MELYMDFIWWKFPNNGWFVELIKPSLKSIRSRALTTVSFSPLILRAYPVLPSIFPSSLRISDSGIKYLDMDVSLNGDIPKWMVFVRKKIPSRNGWWLGVPPLMETSIYTLIISETPSPESSKFPVLLRFTSLQPRAQKLHISPSVSADKILLAKEMCI